MARLSLNDRGRMALSCPYQDKNKAKAVPGHSWSRAERAWTYPLDPLIALQLRDSIPLLQLDEQLANTLNGMVRDRRQRTHSKTAEDWPIQTYAAGQLRAYQRVGAGWIGQAEYALLADDMGLGKTAQAVSACQVAGACDVLVITVNAVRWPWSGEIARWSGKQSTVLRTPKAQREEDVRSYTGGWLVASYDQLRITPQLLKTHWDAVVFDEAHRLKNRKAQTTKVAKKLKTDRVYMLTGTPLLNRADEMWSLLNVMDRKRFSSYWQFAEQYCRLVSNGFGVEIQPGTEEQQKRLVSSLSPIMLRRTKSEVLTELPDKVYKRREVELSGKQATMYRQMADKAVAELSDMDVLMAPQVVAQLTRLRQIALSPRLVDPEHPDVGAKMADALSFIKDSVAGHKVVVFSQFRSAIELLADLLESEGIPTLQVTGSVSDMDRKANTEAFQSDPHKRVILGTIQAAGVGLTWTAGDVCLFLDRHCTPANNTQAEDRLHRMGQRSTVTVVTLTAKDTIEEYVESTLDEKRSLVEAIVDGEVSVQQIV